MTTREHNGLVHHIAAHIGKRSHRASSVLQRMKLALVVLLVGTLLALTDGTAHAGGAVRVTDEGPFTVTNPCNDETIEGSGFVTALYHEGGGHTLHITLRGTGVGSLGNTYRLVLFGNQHFEAPSEVVDSKLVFMLPARAQLISRGSAPNVADVGALRVVVVDGRVESALTTDESNARCLG